MKRSINLRALKDPLPEFCEFDVKSILSSRTL